MSILWVELILHPFTYVGTHSPSFPSLHLRHRAFSNTSFTLPTSQLILQHFRSFTYVTVHSPTLLSLLLRHLHFPYVTWRGAHELNCWLWLCRKLRLLTSHLYWVFLFSVYWCMITDKSFISVDRVQRIFVELCLILVTIVVGSVTYVARWGVEEQW